jgi:hypothetical protein
VRKLIVIASFCLLLLAGENARAQQFDVAFGVSGISGPSAANVSGDHTAQEVGGGAFPGVSADFLFKRHFGVNGEVFWRATQNHYGGFQPFRPILYSFNAIVVPPLGKRASAELMAGIGAQSVRFYQTSFICSFTGCTNYVSTNHLMGHFGGGIRLYLTNNVFIRPEAHIYLVRNNFEFSGSRAARYGVSLGYTWGPER